MICQACAIAPDEHRAHYRSDLHRYNIKRRLAGLPPVTPELFARLAVRRDDPGPAPPSRCVPCGKSFASENALRTHLASRKHRAAAANPAPPHPPAVPVPVPAPGHPPALVCLFCAAPAHSLDDNLAHMASAHSFFVPDAEYLVDPPGLVAHLADQIAVHTLCLFCSRDLRSPHAVRQHMLDKRHCKIAYDSEHDKLALSDYYDFSPSYPDKNSPDDDAWEDIDDGELPHTRLSYGDTEYELVLPSGARIGHRSMMRYYAQSFHGILPKCEDPNSGAALVRRLLADKNSVLVPRKGGFGAFGQGTHVVRARNKGEAREAGRHIREFRDHHRREQFKTKVAFVHNSQKHFRDHLLQ